jgi:hypothetical protein
MKKLIKTIIILLITSNNINAQTKEYFQTAIVIDPCASIKEHGLNIGVEIEYNGFMYVRASASDFAVLKDHYRDYIAGIGVNIIPKKLDQKLRLYGGIRLGVIVRQATNATAGLECGIDYTIAKHFVLGVRSTWDYRSDWIWYSSNAGIRQSGFIKVAYRWNYKT